LPAIKHRVNPEAGWANTKKLKRGPNGRVLCRFCGTEVPKGRRTFCSDGCVHEWRIRSDPGYVRGRLWERDKGVCAICGTDTIEQIKAIEAEFGQESQWGGDRWSGYRGADSRVRDALRTRLDELSIPQSRWYSRRSHWGIWDADHTKPVVEGGGLCGLDGFRTLCCKCHRKESRRLQRRLKEQRWREQDKPVPYRLFGDDDE